jgi:colanic acid/amylovoran biosynthesis glycosyltransferase
MFIGSLPFSRSLRLFVASLITILGIGCVGHFINDWCDIEADKKAGKENRFGLFPSWRKKAVVGGALILAFLPWLILPFNRFSIVLLVLEFLFLLSYAIPPVRLKERVYLAIIADASYAYAIPAALAAHTFFLATETIYDLPFIITVFAWQLLLGSRHFLNHLALDRINDLVSGTHTLATIKGNYWLHLKVRTIILPLELIAFSAFLVKLSQHSILLTIACVALFLIFSSFQLILALVRNYSLFLYRFSSSPLDTFYQTILPLISLFFLLSTEPRFIIFLLIHILLFYQIPLLHNTAWPAQATGVRLLSYRPIKLLVGYPFLALKRISNEKSTPPLANELATRHFYTDRSRDNIAIVNINKSKYTETFINELIPCLNYNVYYLYGDDLPVYDHEDRHFLSGRGSFQSLALFLESLFRLNQKHFLRNSIASYLVAKKIKLVIAEFGPVGVQIFPITRDLGIPLIVCFHGYDVFHQPTWKTHVLSYRELFKEAEKILVVSTHMREKLRERGAPSEKLVHLPAFVNLKLFPYQDRSTQAPRFIAVGRFAETKSPHLTIVAFQRVVQAVPSATLVMIGKGGGGELFEACLILAKALGLEEKIIFKGAMSHGEVAEEMAQARVFVQHSITTPENRDREGKPVAIMEAMSSGLPVIATRHSGIDELITNEVNGLLVEEYDIEAMAEAMILLAKSDSLVKTLGKNASERIQADPLIRDHISRLEGIIQECIST